MTRFEDERRNSTCFDVSSWRSLGHTSNLHLSPDQANVILGVDSRVLRSLYEKFNLFFIPLIDQLNDSLIVGFCSADVELDEVAFRLADQEASSGFAAWRL